MENRARMGWTFFLEQFFHAELDLCFVRFLQGKLWNCVRIFLIHSTVFNSVSTIKEISTCICVVGSGVCRSSHRSCSVIKAVYKNSAIITGKHLWWSLFLINLRVRRPAALLKRDSNTGFFMWILRSF